LKGLQKEVQAPHLGMWSSAMENVKGEKRISNKLDKQSNTGTYLIPEAEVLVWIAELREADSIWLFG
jgi:hypothetical protein